MVPDEFEIVEFEVVVVVTVEEVVGDDMDMEEVVGDDIMEEDVAEAGDGAAAEPDVAVGHSLFSSFDIELIKP